MRHSRILVAALVAATALFPAASIAHTAASPVPAGSDADTRFETKTFEYATKNGRKLLLDRIIDNSLPQSGKRPVIIYSYGGGWEAGARNEALSVEPLRFFAARGYTVVAIDYRLAVKEAKASGEFKPETRIAIYKRAINWGVEDLFDATAFVLKHAGEWNIDPEKIVTLGSSAGATNSLVAEYHRANQTEFARKHLPADFRYAGVIAAAGAFWLDAGAPLTFKTRPAPFMFFHGAKDQLVTYDEIPPDPQFAAYGPVSYQRHYSKPDHPSWFVDFPEGDHIIAAVPFIEYRHEIEAFLDRLVLKKQQAVIHTVETDAVPKTVANVQALYGEYLRANTSPNP